jgi:hypothetical protein
MSNSTRRGRKARVTSKQRQTCVRIFFERIFQMRKIAITLDIKIRKNKEMLDITNNVYAGAWLPGYLYKKHRFRNAYNIHLVGDNVNVFIKKNTSGKRVLKKWTSTHSQLLWSSDKKISKKRM